MTTRREFLRIAATVPLSGTLGLPLVTSGLWAETVANPATESLYMGRPMSEWLARVTKDPYDWQHVYDPEELDVVEYEGPFQSFGEAAVPRLIEALKEPWCKAQGELLMLASPAMVRALTFALEHQRPSVRLPALYILENIACSHPSDRYCGLGSNEPELVEPLREAIGEAVPVIVKMLKVEQDPEVIKSAVRFLYDCGSSLDPTFSFSRMVSESGRPHLWVWAIRKSHLGNQAGEAIPILVASLEDDDPAVRLAAAEALSAIQPDHPGIIPVFVDNAIHQNDFNSLRFSNVDRFIEKALPLLQEALHDANPERRASVLSSISDGGSPAAVPTIMEMLEDEDEQVRSEAVYSLYRSKDLSAAPFLVSLLVRQLQDPAQGVREQARGLFRTNHPLALSALPELIKLLQEGNVYGRVSAALVVRNLGEEAREALPALWWNLEHEDPDVRLAAAVAFAAFESNGEELVHVLAMGIEHPDKDLRESAIWEIQRIRLAAKAVLPKIVEGIEHALEHAQSPEIDYEDIQRLQGLIWIVGFVGPEAASAIPVLIQSLEVRSSTFTPGLGAFAELPILEAFVKIGPQAIDPLLRAVHTGNLLVRRRALEVLGLMGPPARAFVPMFVKLLENASAVIRITAAQALGHIGPDAAVAIPVLKTLLKDRDILLRRRVEEALSKIEGKAKTVGQLVEIATQATTGDNPKKTLFLEASQIVGKPLEMIRDFERKRLREPSESYEFTWVDEYIWITGSNSNGIRATWVIQIMDSPKERADIEEMFEWLESWEAMETETKNG